MFYDVSQCFTMYHNVLRCITMFYDVSQCFTMYRNVLHVFHIVLCLASSATISVATTNADRLRDRDNAAGIGDNSAEIGDGAARIVNIAVNVISCQTPS